MVSNCGSIMKESCTLKQGFIQSGVEELHWV